MQEQLRLRRNKAVDPCEEIFNCFFRDFGGSAFVHGRFGGLAVEDPVLFDAADGLVGAADFSGDGFGFPA